MKSKALKLLFIALPLCLGILIYATTRSDDLSINQWIAALGLHPIKDTLADLLSLSSLPYWVRFSLPDGLWMLALTMCILVIWNFKLDKKSMPWIGLALLLGIGFEIFQGLHWIKGSFDLMDLVLILSGVCLPILILFIKFHFLNKRVCEIS